MQILQDQRNEAHVGDLVLREGFANILGPQCSQVDNGGATSERPEEANHEIDGVIGGQDTEITHARPKG